MGNGQDRIMIPAPATRGPAPAAGWRRSLLALSAALVALAAPLGHAGPALANPPGGEAPATPAPGDATSKAAPPRGDALKTAPAGGDAAAASPARAGASEAAPPSAEARGTRGGRTGRSALRVKVRTQAIAAGLPPEIADAVAEVESGYNTGAIGGYGEVGLMQVLPSTARMLGFQGEDAALAEADINIRYGVRYLATAWRLSGQDLCTTVMKYRAGHGETRFSHRSVDYCRRVRAVLASQGYAVTGELPVATFGEPVGAGAAITGGRPARKKFAGSKGRSRINWTAADARMRAIQHKITAASLVIAQ